MAGFTTFETAIGDCGIAWDARGLITGVWLPGRMRGAPPENAPAPPLVADAIERIRALLGGEPDDLTSVDLDMDGLPEFHRRVYEAARAIRPGEVLTYGEVADRIGEPGAAQAVGQALGRNPFPIVVPCHRVLAASGRLGGFSAPGGTDTKLRLLAIEGARRDRDALTLF